MKPDWEEIVSEMGRINQIRFETLEEKVRITSYHLKKNICELRKSIGELQHNMKELRGRMESVEGEVD